MKQSIQYLSLYFFAGTMGGLINSLLVWLCGYSGINNLLGVSIGPTLSAAWLYPRIVWGGLWGCIFFFVKIQKKFSLLKAFLISLGPSLIQLLIIFPFKANKGYLGLDLGMLTPLIVLFFNFAWGITAVFILSTAVKVEPRSLIK